MNSRTAWATVIPSQVTKQQKKEDSLVCCLMSVIPTLQEAKAEGSGSGQLGYTGRPCLIKRVQFKFVLKDACTRN